MYPEHLKRLINLVLFPAIGAVSLTIVALFMTLAAILYPDLLEDKIITTINTSQLSEEKFIAPEIIDGIHVKTGLKEGEGLNIVLMHCTNCHSAKLITQNRMTADRWRHTIHWMQRTQNLWDLGDNEEVIVNYLATNYAPEKKGRRAQLEDIEWYELD